MFSGCTEEPAPDPDAALKEDVLVNGFENWTPDLQTALIYNDFGKVSLNTDKKFITQGERSARLDPLGGKYVSSSAPIVMFSLRSDTYGFDYSDLSYAEYVTFDMYNDQNEDKTCLCGVCLGHQRRDVHQPRRRKRALRSAPAGTNANCPLRRRSSPSRAI